MCQFSSVSFLLICVFFCLEHLEEPKGGVGGGGREGVPWNVSQASTNIHLAHKVPDDLASEDEMTKQTQGGILSGYHPPPSPFKGSLSALRRAAPSRRKIGPLGSALPSFQVAPLSSFYTSFLCHDTFCTAVQG